MKTNHQREFVGKYLPFPGGDSTNGKHGMAKSKRGLKKFYNSRFRFNSDNTLRSKLKSDDIDISISDLDNLYKPRHGRSLRVGYGLQ